MSALAKTWPVWSCILCREWGACMIPSDSVIEAPDRERKLHVCLQSETVTHLESFPIIKQDRERFCFNGERESERKKWKQQSLSVPPAVSFYQHWLCSQAELMPTCCTQMASICIDVCVCVFVRGRREECLCVSVSLSYVFTQFDSWRLVFFSSREMSSQAEKNEHNPFLLGTAPLRGSYRVGTGV